MSASLGDSNSPWRLFALWNLLVRRPRVNIRSGHIRTETGTLLYTGTRSFTALFESQDARTTWEALMQIETQVTDICRMHGGRVLVTFNGSVCAKFSTAPAALTAALDAAKQCNTLATASSQAYPTRLQPQLICGLHTGPLYILGDRCYGSSINTTQRVCGLVIQFSTPNLPGDVMVSGSTAALLPPQLPGGFKLLRVGDVPVKGSENPLELFLVIAQKSVLSTFISYRREGGAEIARLISSQLQRRGVTTFLDIDDLGAQCFDERLLNAIKSAQNFVLILSPGSLDRCGDENDWLRQEISLALRLRKNIVPVFKEGFVFPDPTRIPQDLADLPRYNCVTFSHEYFGASLDRLVGFLV